MDQVVLFSDQPVLSEGLRAVCRDSGTLVLAHTFHRLSDLKAALLDTNTRLAVIDFRPEMDLASLREACRGVSHCRIVLLARAIQPELAYQAREAGISAVLSTTLSLNELTDAFTRILHGEILFDPSLTDGLDLARTVRLTPREGQLVSLLAQGLKNKEIATVLGISEGTVKVYLSKLFDKVGAKDRFELALFGLKNLGGTNSGFTKEPPIEAARPAPFVRVQPLNSLVMRMTQAVPVPTHLRTVAP